MGSGKTVGIVAGVSVGVVFIIIVAFLYDAQDDARLADLRATYFDDEDRLAVAVVLTNADGEFTKANGHLELIILKDGHVVYSNEYDFTKNDFLTWDNLFTGKTMGVPFIINERFTAGDHDVSVNLKTNSGYWEDLHASFYSIEPVEVMVPEPVPQQVTEPESEPIQQQVTEPSTQTQVTPNTSINPANCSGTARCISGTVTQVTDGDTISVGGQSIRFALASTPESYESGGQDAKQFVEQICPVGSEAIVDEDDFQTEGSYGRIVAVIYCNGVNVNEAVLDAGYGYLSSGFCNKSEFENTAWAQKHGCETTIQEVNPPQTTQTSCDPHYPTVCIPTYPPDLDCGEISYKRFQVLQPDPHGFDGDKDGIGCES